MSPGLMLVVRTLHIVIGALWAGGMVLAALFVIPSVQAAGAAGGPVMRQLVQVRKLPAYMMSLGGLTVLTGIALMWSDARGSDAWMRSPFGHAISIGAALAVIALLIGSIVNAPAARRLGALAAAAQDKGGAPDAATTAEIQRLQRRMLRITRVVAGLITLATVAMASARYM
jgi:hypothetical protein